jgi:myosin-1
MNSNSRFIHSLCNTFISSIDDLVEVVQTSSCSYAQYLGWKSIVLADGQKKKPPTVGMQFKKQVAKLMECLHACVPHYIRCIKPNNTKKPNDFDNKNSLRQVKYLGLLENVRVRRAGYAHRTKFEAFVARYRLVGSECSCHVFPGSLHFAQNANLTINMQLHFFSN